MGYGFPQTTTERTRSIRLRYEGGDDDDLVLTENGTVYQLEVRATRYTVTVGCTSITRRAWDRIVREVEKQS